MAAHGKAVSASVLCCLYNQNKKWNGLQKYNRTSEYHKTTYKHSKVDIQLKVAAPPEGSGGMLLQKS